MNGELRKEEEKEDAEEQMKITGDEKHEEKEGKYRHPSVDTMKTDLKIEEEESNEEKKKEQTISL
ncbi:hypothetical protein CSUI_011486 [Cystoisospora suis]|uniref:Uncharacterized protein n=1 Tax=Cystoisospora suis TaxID=483139 RepID=A0A2C6KE62_9APIC|nr:hypothetical protein CSUI_011486 [Cystoisospora suis]